jgi:hypothetical protein
LITRTLGGESSARGLLGGSVNRSRGLGLGIVFVAGLFLTLYGHLFGLLVTFTAGALVVIGTSRTHNGSVWARVQRRLWWRERQRRGLRDFRPLTGQQDPPPPAGSGGRAQARREQNLWRDFPDAAPMMYWLQTEADRPGVAWHFPPGETAYLSVAFHLSGAVRGIESDLFVDACSTAYGGMLARLGAPSSLPSTVQMLTRVLPIDSARHEQWVVANSDPQAPGHLQDSYEEVLRSLGHGGLTQRHYAVIRWPITAAFVDAAKRLGPGHRGWLALMDREIPAATRMLTAARLGRIQPLTAAQTAAVIRHLQLPDWPIEQLTDLHARPLDLHHPWFPSHDEWSYVSITGAVPTWQATAADATWHHRTAHVPIESVETGPRTALWMAPLLSRMPEQVVRTISVQIEGVPAGIARSGARSDLSSDIAEIETDRRKGRLTDEDAQVRLRAARSRLADLDPGSGHQGAGWAMHLTISARTSQALADASKRIEEAADTAGITSLTWLDAHQSAAFGFTWPIARGMKPMATTMLRFLGDHLAGTGHKEALT